MSTLRPLLRKAAYRSGALGMVRSRLRRALTVVMFHRVIDPADPDFAAADPTYTLSLPLFEKFLGFLQNHYNIVRLADVAAASDGRRGLPEHALLITFDDGWADNLRYAAPALKARKMPAVVFVVAEAIQSRTDAWWHERVFAAARAGALTERSAIDVVSRVGLLDEATREESLTALPCLPCHRRMMLEPDELPRLADYGIDIGSHGYTHVPLTRVPDVANELTRARCAIDRMTKGTSVGTALGCPHGQYDAEVVRAARAIGIEQVFTSDAWLNATEDGKLPSDKVLGRINVSTENIADEEGRFDPSAAARWLWTREARA
jgi:peptidoglycan/xylan/chitin deacetylase (PgdA/CDA1 family)